MIDLPLLSSTTKSWAERAAANLDTFLADHAICEQQAAQSALSLVGQYPHDEELVEKLTALAAEEIAHLRRVAAILRARRAPLAHRRPNGYVRALRAGIDSCREPDLLGDRLLVCALIEARSCERFTRLAECVTDPAVADLLADLGPCEERHWRLFHDLARSRVPGEWLETRWRRWLELERGAIADRGVSPTVHG